MTVFKRVGFNSDRIYSCNLSVMTQIMKEVLKLWWQEWGPNGPTVLPSMMMIHGTSVDRWLAGKT